MLQNIKNLYGDKLAAPDKPLPLKIQFQIGHRFEVCRLADRFFTGGSARVFGAQLESRRHLGLLCA